MRRPAAHDVQIQIKQEDDDWWGLIYFFPDDPNEVPLLVGPCADRETAEQRAHTLAKDIISSST
jgi:hypothetical protein